ncbi:MAG: integron integrase, partial [Polyangiales bacterium]
MTAIVVSRSKHTRTAQQTQRRGGPRVDKAPRAQSNATDASSPARPKTLLDAVRKAIRVRHYSPRTEEAYVNWTRRLIRYHRGRHPRDLEPHDISEFVSSLATVHNCAASTQNQALSALIFLYRHVLGAPFDWLEGIVTAKRPERLPVVLSPPEVGALLAELEPLPRLMAGLIYGSGLRLLECCQLRVKDLDLERGEILVRDGKGRKDRITMLPQGLVEPLHIHLHRLHTRLGELDQHQRGFVRLPDALARKYPNAPAEWVWYWVFPASRTHVDPKDGLRYRHHYHETALQRAVTKARRRARIPKPATCHALRH